MRVVECVGLAVLPALLFALLLHDRNGPSIRLPLAPTHIMRRQRTTLVHSCLRLLSRSLNLTSINDNLAFFEMADLPQFDAIGILTQLLLPFQEHALLLLLQHLQYLLLCVKQLSLGLRLLLGCRRLRARPRDGRGVQTAAPVLEVARLQSHHLEWTGVVALRVEVVELRLRIGANCGSTCRRGIAIDVGIS